MRRPQTPIKIAHLITSLASGGAEMMLSKLVSRMNRDRFQNEVITLMGSEGMVAARILQAGVPIRSLEMNRGRFDPRPLVRLARMLRSDPPTVLQCWMYHADLLGLAASVLARTPRLIWNIRASDLDFDGLHRPLRRVFALHGHLAPLPDVVIVNSESGLHYHRQRRHRARRWEVISNGFETDRFRPDSAARKRIRQDLGIGERPAVGILARYDAMKDYPTFLRAARLLLDTHPDATFLLVGRGVEPSNHELKQLVTELKLANAVHLMGERADTPAVIAALDVLSLCSTSGEGLPNVLGEAMSTGVPCVATPVGDSARILGDLGRIVPARSPEAFAAAWRDLINIGPESRAAIGAKSRERIETHFSLATIVSRYEQLYSELAPCAE